MYIRSACCRLSRHGKLIYTAVVISLLLLLLFAYVAVAPYVRELLVVRKPPPGAEETFPDETRRRQHVVPGDSPTVATNSRCTFYDCFDIYRCSHRSDGDFKVYVYPTAKHVDPNGIPIGGKTSKEYRSVLNAIAESRYYTRNPDEACVFVPSIDTLNQNRFRVKETSQALALLP